MFTNEQQKQQNLTTVIHTYVLLMKKEKWLSTSILMKTNV